MIVLPFLVPPERKLPHIFSLFTHIFSFFFSSHWLCEDPAEIRTFLPLNCLPSLNYLPSRFHRIFHRPLCRHHSYPPLNPNPSHPSNYTCPPYQTHSPTLPCRIPHR